MAHKPPKRPILQFDVESAVDCSLWIVPASLRRRLTVATMFQSLRASRSLLTRVARQQSPIAVRTFATTSARQGRRVKQAPLSTPDADQYSPSADPVQELYLRELRAYKPAPLKPSDAEAYVQKFVMPTPPPSPEEANIASELKAYETQDVEVEGQAAPGETAAVEEDWFELPEEEEASAAH
ncbi:conserved hypothetical protein [Uncinocarpus reesii 1704]|uniref:Mitochondrial F1F0 ATP synthase subunit Atp14 n=1 Tax=Uncinocarpus reesii (strain UAMH 1704) TaxID=336963 RepID=C4JYZ6_UNCRE|nr:uncharacterized protein UREG_07397 [Uncinocarpus reesii 1704]EEP82532.1 conserved hypothetical protein [Uncinocarpus reesii 1704]